LRSGGERGSPPGHVVSIACAPEATLPGCKTRNQLCGSAGSALGGQTAGITSPAACGIPSPGKQPATTGSVLHANKRQKVPRASDQLETGRTRAKEPQFAVSMIGRKLRKLVGLLEQIPPSLGTEEPWKRAYQFATTLAGRLRLPDRSRSRRGVWRVRQDKACRP
jgi:hypothetical protein